MQEKFGLTLFSTIKITLIKNKKQIKNVVIKTKKFLSLYSIYTYIKN